MPRFFVEKTQISTENIVIDGNDATHIGRSLRMKVGEEIIVCCKGTEYDCEILSISDSAVNCKIIKSKQGENEPDIQLTLFQAMPKSDKLETIVQKSVELGVYRIVPMISSRCISRPDVKTFEKKRARLNKIALEAAKQCGRCIIPTVEPLVNFESAVKIADNLDKKIICYEKGGINLRECGLAGQQKIALFIGSEGGFEQSEVDFCLKNGFTAASLGKRILRCETAPIAATAVIMNLTDNL